MRSFLIQNINLLLWEKNLVGQELWSERTNMLTEHGTKTSSAAHHWEPSFSHNFLGHLEISGLTSFFESKYTNQVDYKNYREGKSTTKLYQS